MGEWARDSHSILYGEMEFWGGIPGVKVNEMDIPSGEIKPIFMIQASRLSFTNPGIHVMKGSFSHRSG